MILRASRPILCACVLAAGAAHADPGVSANLNLVSQRWNTLELNAGIGSNGSTGVVGASNDRFFRPPTGGLSLTDDATRALNRTAVVLQVGRSF